jgi:uncharacterized protein (DUF58 family)
MTRLGGTGALAAGVLVGAWLVGSTALAVLGAGLALAALAVRAWTRVVAGGLGVERRPVEGAPVEGETLRLEVEVRGRRWLASRLVWRERVDVLGEHSLVVGRGGRATLVLDAVPRGRYVLGPGRLTAADPLGLGRVELTVESSSSVTVRPRVPELHTLFTDGGTWGEGGRRAVARRPSGLEPHGMREYAEGEPLRAVHWPTSARRGELMVRELDDTPRESVAVVLDVEATSVAGPRGDSSLDDAVRAAAGLLRAHALRSRQVVLAIAGPQPEVHRLRSFGADWEIALDALAAAEPASGARLRELVAPRGPFAMVPELVVVTGRPDVVADALVARAAVGRSSALVAVDAPTYAGRQPATASPTLLRLAGARVGVAVLRHGCSLPEALGGIRDRAALG